eukprot:2885658-Rhodomonas_salina.1
MALHSLADHSAQQPSAEVDRRLGTGNGSGTLSGTFAHVTYNGAHLHTAEKLLQPVAPTTSTVTFRRDLREGREPKKRAELT